MHIHYLQHVDFEGPGYIEQWALDKGFHISGTRLYDNEPLPNLEGIDLLIVMGGPMGVYDDDQYPWLVREKAYIQHAIELGKRVLGICLGAQLLAHVLGGKVTPAPQTEIGWFPVTHDNNHPLLTELPESFTAFHWHGDIFDIPSGAIPLFMSAGCPNQGFIYRDHVIGFQFHFETTPESLSAMLANDDVDAYHETYVQSAATIREKDHQCQQLNTYLANILTRLSSETHAY
jgi:GMP synthase-like glutamine amidotransferase